MMQLLVIFLTICSINAMDHTKIEYVYHAVPQNMQGTIIYPLNLLRDKYPDLYNRHVQKYKNRPDLATTTPVPVVPNATWSDFSYFLPIHPYAIYQAFDNRKLWDRGDVTKRAAFVDSLEFFEVPITALQEPIVQFFDANPDPRTGDMSMDKLTGKDSSTGENRFFNTLKTGDYRQLTALLATTTAYLDCAQQDPARTPKNIFLYIGTPHILSNQPLETKNLRRIKWAQPPN